MSEPYSLSITRGYSPINDAIIDYLKPRITAPYLDVGCNSGWLLSEVEGGTGIDSSPNFGGHGKVFLGRAEELPFQDKLFKTVVLSCVLEQCEDWRKALSEARRVGEKVIGINPWPGSRWGVVGGWVKSVIDTEELWEMGAVLEWLDDERYYFEVV